MVLGSLIVHIEQNARAIPVADRPAGVRATVRCTFFVPGRFAFFSIMDVLSGVDSHSADDHPIARLRLESREVGQRQRVKRNFLPERAERQQ